MPGARSRMVGVPSTCCVLLPTRFFVPSRSGFGRADSTPTTGRGRWRDDARRGPGSSCRASSASLLRPRGRPHIVYFDHVIKAMVAARPELSGRIHVHEPPPMGVARGAGPDPAGRRPAAPGRRAPARRNARTGPAHPPRRPFDRRARRAAAREPPLPVPWRGPPAAAAAPAAPRHGGDALGSSTRHAHRRRASCAAFLAWCWKGCRSATIMANAGRVTKRLGYPGSASPTRCSRR